ncbi:MAG: hypothetical protein FJY85_04575 [Deltaproteobacteria bacterium]|nr:hypothetical protein [Deltaproteobacteria bacterium]
MKLKHFYADRIGEDSYTLLDYLIEEDGDLEKLREFLSIRKRNLNTLDLEFKSCVGIIYTIWRNPPHSAGKSSDKRKRFYSSFCEELFDYSPTLSFVFQQVYPTHQKILDYKKKKLRDIQFPGLISSYIYFSEED